MIIRFNHGHYEAFADYCGKWFPFWDNDKAAILFGNIRKDRPTIIDDDVCHPTNCGTGFIMHPSESHYTPCSGLWPNPLCPNCKGLGVGFSIDYKYDQTRT